MRSKGKQMRIQGGKRGRAGAKLSERRRQRRALKREMNRG